ncbi:MAG TPA: VTT domain-containing protein [Anaerolineaceae bacterium]
MWVSNLGDFTLADMASFLPPIHQLGMWSYLALAAIVMVEGPAATIIGAMAASMGYMHPAAVFVFAALGNLTGDICWYLLGYLGKIEWIEHYGKRFGLNHEFVLDLEKTIQKNVLKIIFIAKLTMGFMIPILVATGLARIPLKRWFVILAGAESIWTGGLVLMGFYFGKYLQTMRIGLQILTVAGFIFFAYAGYRWLVRHRPTPMATSK